MTCHADLKHEQYAGNIKQQQHILFMGDSITGQEAGVDPTSASLGRLFSGTSASLWTWPSDKIKPFVRKTQEKGRDL